MQPSVQPSPPIPRALPFPDLELKPFPESSEIPFPASFSSPCSCWWPRLPAVLRVLARTRLSHGCPLWPPSTPASLHTQASSFLLSIFLFLVSIYLLVIQGQLFTAVIAYFVNTFRDRYILWCLTLKNKRLLILRNTPYKKSNFNNLRFPPCGSG